MRLISLLNHYQHFPGFVYEHARHIAHRARPSRSPCGRAAGGRPSMGSVGDAYDNAMCESFFATLECKLLARCRFKTQAEARNATFVFIEGFYNPRRRHSSIGYLSPVDYERRHHVAGDPNAHKPAAVLATIKDKPFGRPQEGAVLDRRSADGRTIVPAGTEEWLRRGPNQRMSPNWRTK